MSNADHAPAEAAMDTDTEMALRVLHLSMHQALNEHLRKGAELKDILEQLAETHGQDALAAWIAQQEILDPSELDMIMQTVFEPASGGLYFDPGMELDPEILSDQLSELFDTALVLLDGNDNTGDTDNGE